MISREVLKSLVENYQKELKKIDYIEREIDIKLEKGFAVVISGIRRCGKSTLAKQLVKGKKV